MQHYNIVIYLQAQKKRQSPMSYKNNIKSIKLNENIKHKLAQQKN